MRLLAGAQLNAADADALDHGRPLEDLLVERLMLDPSDAESVIVKNRLEVLAWMVREGRLEVRIVVPLDKDGRVITGHASGPYFHEKSAVFADDAGERLAIVGSNNESAAGWEDAGNAERFQVYPSWDEHTWDHYGHPIQDGFESAWSGNLKHWLVVPLPEAVRQDLIRRVTHAGELPFQTEDDLAERTPHTVSRKTRPEPTILATTAEWEAAAARLRSLLEAPTRDGGTGVGIVTAPVEPWPHQRRIAQRVTSTFPRSYLFADEVGMGKTIEAGVIIRQYILDNPTDHEVLVLVPRHLVRQWQGELEG
jgi:hypothetical protein